MKKKWLDYIVEKQKINIGISGDILKEKKHKQKTKVRTHSRDEKKITDWYGWKIKDVHKDKWRHLLRKKTKD